MFGRDESSFFSSLQRAEVDAFIDIRQRRGVRGSQYAFVNSNRLQARLEELGIAYAYIKDLAPTTEVRDAQKQADARLGIAKRERRRLGSAFVDAYQHDILDPLSPDRVLEQFPSGCRRPVLFCVEGELEACHRSLAVNWLAQAFGLAASEVQ